MNERMNLRKIRNQKGAAVTGLVLALFFFIMLIGFFCFDSSRIQMAQRELTATCDSASLAGTAMLTSYNTANDSSPTYPLTVQAQSGACAYARNMFQAGNLLGQSLANANVVGSYAAVGVTGAPGSTNVMISLADPTNNYQGVAPTPPGCLAGKAIMCYACYTYTPVFLWIVGVTNVGLNAASGGGLPQVDAVMVFDFSGSMDDATNVTFMRRTWDSTIGGALINASAPSLGIPDEVNLTSPQVGGTPYPGLTIPTVKNGAVHYIEVTPPTTSHRLSDYLQFNYSNNPNGLNLNVLPPQNIDLANNPDSLAAPNFMWDQNLRTNINPWKAGLSKVGLPIPGQASGGNWQTDYGTPPGNCTLQTPYGYGNFWYPSSAGTAMTVGPAGSSQMAYRTDERSTLGGVGPDTIYMQNPQVYAGYDYTMVGSQREFTDIVVNIAPPGTWPYSQPLTGPNGIFVGFSNCTFPSQEPDTNIAGQSFSFEDLGVLVEASRGNLDTNQNARGALLDRNAYWTIYGDNGTTLVKQQSAVGIGHVQVGYQEAYQRLAMLFSQPIATCVDGADGGFFQKVNSLCDCRFGFCGFSNADNLNVGSSPNSLTVGTAQGTTPGSADSFFVSTQYSAVPQWNAWWDGASTATYGGANNTSGIAGGTGNGFRTPRRPLKFLDTQPISVNGVDGCRINASFSGGVTAGTSASWNQPIAAANGLENGNPVDHTDTDEAVNTARYMFLDPANYNILNVNQSRPAAKHAIVFFTDGVPTGGPSGSDASAALAVASQCKGDGIAIYAIGMDVTNNPILQTDQQIFLGNSGGLAGNSGNGGRAFYCTSSITVQQAFNAVARRLAQSQR